MYYRGAGDGEGEGVGAGVGLRSYDMHEGASTFIASPEHKIPITRRSCTV